jgi:AraC family transcriptional regulator
MFPRIENLPEKKLVGQHMQMSLTENRTFELWSGFMPHRKEITNAVSTDLISMQVYDQDFFSPSNVFEKWAAVEVSDFDQVPQGMETFILPAGMYAVFHYKGTPDKFEKTFKWIFGIWLPSSEFEVDSRPHFELLGAKYKNNDPESEEDIWVPVRVKDLIT